MSYLILSKGYELLYCHLGEKEKKKERKKEGRKEGKENRNYLLRI
jgi:hypothetical protein